MLPAVDLAAASCKVNVAIDFLLSLCAVFRSREKFIVQRLISVDIPCRVQTPALYLGRGTYLSQYCFLYTLGHIATNGHSSVKGRFTRRCMIDWTQNTYPITTLDALPDSEVDTAREFGGEIPSTPENPILCCTLASEVT